MGDHQGRLGAVNLGPFVGVDLNLLPTVYIAVIVLDGRKMIQTKPTNLKGDILAKKKIGCIVNPPTDH